MERRNSKQWINDLKIALINNDLEKIKSYSDREVPTFNSIEDAQEALKLIESSKKILKIKKEEINKKLNSLKQSQKYSNEYKTLSTNNWKA